jgi:molybdate transport system regulatory protein
MAKRNPPKPSGPPMLRAKLWLDVSGAPVMTDDGADLLEQILATGSLSEAARQLRFSYRRAWMLMDGMNRKWPKPLVKKAIGGEHGGGTRLTELGEMVLRSYRDAQLQIEHALGQATDSFMQAVRSVQ